MRSLYYVLDDDGEPRAVDDVLVWAEWFERASRDGTRVVKQDYAEGSDDRVGVSTVFLGLDHNHGVGRPVLWESLVFGTALDGEQRRYSSKAAAIRGHEALLRRVSEVFQQSGSTARLEAPASDDSTGEE